MIPLSSNPAKLGLGKKKGGGIGGAGAAAAEEGRVAYVEFLVSVFENQESSRTSTDFFFDSDSVSLSMNELMLSCVWRDRIIVVRMLR